MPDMASYLRGYRPVPREEAENMTTVVATSSSVASRSNTPDVDLSKELKADVKVREDAPPLGAPYRQKRFFWQKSLKPDPNAIATLVSVPYFRNA